MMVKTTTHCPTCGAECKVEGHTTHYYRPVSAGELKRIAELEAENGRLKPLAKSAELELVDEYLKGKRAGMEQAAEICDRNMDIMAAEAIRAEIKEK